MPRFRLHHLVMPEFNTARAWYAGRSALASENFALRFSAALTRIESHPTAHAPWHSIFRRCRVAHFPYLVIFHTDTRWTSLLAVTHERSEPGRIVAQLKERLGELA